MKWRRHAWLAVSAMAALVLLPWAALAVEPPQSGRPPKASSMKLLPSKGSRTLRLTDAVARRGIAAGPTRDDASVGVESPELRALRDAEQELFPPAAPTPGGAWATEFPLLLPSEGAPRVHTSGLPPAGPTAVAPLAGDAASDLSWLSRLEMPDLPVRWDERVIRYVEFFRDDPRGRATFANLFRRSGRVRDMMRRALRKKSLPEDLVWVSMIESGFDPTARSVAGAAGLWQFMPETAKIYGLAIDRWLDQRYSAPLATAAAIDLLGDLHRRFGSWELALAAYNMGYAGLASVVRRYNSNDFWSLSRAEGSLPWETTLYVPKILAVAVVAHNLSDFGYGDLAVDSPVDCDTMDVPAGTSLALVAQAVSCDPKDIETLNPELRAGHTPPLADGEGPYLVRVPAGKGASGAHLLARLRKDPSILDRYVVRFGETLEQVAASHQTTPQRLVELNAIAPGEVVRGGTTLLVPVVEERPSGHAPAPAGGPATHPDRTPAEGLDPPPPSPTAPAKPWVVVPAELFAYPDRRRVFYRVLVGDNLKEIAAALRVSVDDLCRWNDLDAGARLVDGMTVQAFVPADADLAHVVVAGEGEVHTVTAGSDEFFASVDQKRGFKRLAVAAKVGDTVEAIARRFGVSPRTMERINRRGRSELLKAGETVFVYAPAGLAAPFASATLASSAPTPNGPLPDPPLPDLLP